MNIVASLSDEQLSHTTQPQVNPESPIKEDQYHGVAHRIRL